MNEDQKARQRTIISALLVLSACGYWDELKSELERSYLNSLGNDGFNAEAERQRLLGVQQLLDSMTPKAEALQEAIDNAQ